MGLPKINISFITAGIEAVQRSTKGVVALILRGTGDDPVYFTVYDVTDIPSDVGDASGSTDNYDYIVRALMGYQTPPKKLLVYIMASDATSLTDALDYFEKQQFDYMCAPPDVTTAECTSIVTWIKACHANSNAIYTAVLPNTAADSELVVNYTTTSVTLADGTTLDAAAMCSRIAGLIAGTPMSISCTFAPLSELTDCTRLTVTEGDTAVDAGKFMLVYDGTKVKVGKAVNSFVTTTSDKGSAYQKIKLVELMHMIDQDLRLTAEDSYIGKYPNSYDSKCLLITAIDGYFEQLYNENLVASGWTVGIDVTAVRAWLKSNGTDVSDMTDNEIKVSDTGDEVFLAVTLTLLDAIENITISATI